MGPIRPPNPDIDTRMLVPNQHREIMGRVAAATVLLVALLPVVAATTVAVNRTPDSGGDETATGTPFDTTMAAATAHTPRAGGRTQPMRGGAALVKPLGSDKMSSKGHVIDVEHKPMRTTPAVQQRGDAGEAKADHADVHITTTTTAPGGHDKANTDTKGLSTEAVATLAMVCLLLTMVSGVYMHVVVFPFYRARAEVLE